MVAITPETPSMKLKIEVIQSKELLQPSNKKLLRTLSRLINDTFALHGHPKDNGETKPGALFISKRLMRDEEFPERMGPVALTAICYDESLQDGDAVDGKGQTGQYGNIVATGSVYPFKGKMADLERSAREAMNAQMTTNDTKSLNITDQEVHQVGKALANETAVQLLGHWNWEVKLCSSSDEPQYRGRGLMIRCVDALIAQLKSQQASMRDLCDPTGDMPIKLWITSLDGTGNTEYWIRRGFAMVGEADIAPAGMWTSTRDISISTLSKVVE